MLIFLAQKQSMLQQLWLHRSVFGLNDFSIGYVVLWSMSCCNIHYVSQLLSHAYKICCHLIFWECHVEMSPGTLRVLNISLVEGSNGDE